MSSGMDAERIASLRENRAALAAQLDRMLATPETDRPTSRRGLNAWRVQLEGTQRALEMVDRLLKMMASKPKRAFHPRAAAGEEDSGLVLGRLPKGPRAELRIVAKTWQGRRIVDLRCWSASKETGEFGPTRKGVAIDARMLPDIIEALLRAQNVE